MKFLNTQVMNFEGALHGMRNPLNSWDKSDSYFGFVDPYSEQDFDIASLWGEREKPEYYGDNYWNYATERDDLEEKYVRWLNDNGILKQEDYVDEMYVAYIGPKDMELAQRLIKAGPEHRKFMRQIFVSVDITAPGYWWREFDTYKIGTTANSTSTMHTLASTPITLDCFEIGDMYDLENWREEDSGYEFNQVTYIDTFIRGLEGLRQKFNETKDQRYWKELVRWLPQSWKQTRTVTMNYEIIRNIYFQRSYHKLIEWSVAFVNWVKSLPYANELILIK